MRLSQIFLFLMLALLSACVIEVPSKQLMASVAGDKPILDKKKFRLGAERFDQYLPLLKGKRIGMMVNQTSLVGDAHLVDILLRKGMKIEKILAIEHGFRGNADAGEHVENGVDVKTGINVVSVYGKTKKPSEEMLKGIDVLLFDIQDVGLRFFTYISSLHYLMEAAAELKIPLIVLDRPNPNGRFVDGPILEKQFKSFVGMHPVPIFHGMTVGEYAKMINGEGWLQGHLKADLTVVPMTGYVKSMPYLLPVKPSPNLPNDQSIKLYGSLCLFEGTAVSVGRGTKMPFQIYGMPDETFGTYKFTPVSINGMAKHPKYEGKACYGEDLRTVEFDGGLNLKWLLKAYEKSIDKDDFFNNYFNKLAGNERLMNQIKDRYSEEKIRSSWVKGLQAYNKMRERYLIYD